jgi:hypothetical protein
MAVSTDSYFSNSVIGVPQVGGDIDIYETNSTPKYAIGFGFTRADGNKYRYSHFGATVSVSNLVAVDVSESGFTHSSGSFTTAAKLSKRAGETLNPNAKGSRYMQLTITASADQFAGGYIAITSGLGYGFSYRVKGNTATTAGVPCTGDIYLDLCDPLQAALDTRSAMAIAGCPYANLEVTSTTDCIPVGVTVTDISSSAYGWICTKGVTPVLQDATIPTGTKKVAQVSTATAGAITSLVDSHTSYPIVGNVIESGSSTVYSLIYLTLE